MRKYILGAICGFFLAVSASAYAEDAKMEIKNLVGKVVTGSFPVSVNGVEIEDSAVVIDDIGYLPTRAIAEALRAEVTFDADLGISVKLRMEESVITDRKVERMKLDNSMKLDNKPLTPERLGRIIESRKEGLPIEEGKIRDYELARPNETEKINLMKSQLEAYKAEIADLERQKAELTK